LDTDAVILVVLSWMVSFFFDPAFDEQMRAYDDAQDLHRLRAGRRGGVAPSAAQRPRRVDNQATSGIGMASAVARVPR